MLAQFGRHGYLLTTPPFGDKSEGGSRVCCLSDPPPQPRNAKGSFGLTWEIDTWVGHGLVWPHD